MAYRNHAVETILLMLKTPFLIFIGILSAFILIPLMIIHIAHTHNEDRKRKRLAH